MGYTNKTSFVPLKYFLIGVVAFLSIRFNLKETVSTERKKVLLATWGT
jgi:hypothetical protein